MAMSRFADLVVAVDGSEPVRACRVLRAGAGGPRRGDALLLQRGRRGPTRAGAPGRVHATARAVAHGIEACAGVPGGSRRRGDRGASRRGRSERHRDRHARPQRRARAAGQRRGRGGPLEHGPGVHRRRRYGGPRRALDRGRGRRARRPPKRRSTPRSSWRWNAARPCTWCTWWSSARRWPARSAASPPSSSGSGPPALPTPRSCAKATRSGAGRRRRAARAALIATGTHGHNAIARLVLGSVAEGLVREAQVPVMTVRA